MREPLCYCRQSRLLIRKENRVLTCVSPSPDHANLLIVIRYQRTAPERRIPGGIERHLWQLYLFEPRRCKCPPRRRRHLTLDRGPSIVGLIGGYTASCHYGQSKIPSATALPRSSVPVCPPRVAAVLASGVYQGQLAIKQKSAASRSGQSNRYGNICGANEWYQGTHRCVRRQLSQEKRRCGCDPRTRPQARGPEPTYVAACECCQICRSHRANKPPLSPCHLPTYSRKRPFTGPEFLGTDVKGGCGKPLKPGGLGTASRSFTSSGCVLYCMSMVWPSASLRPGYSKRPSLSLSLSFFFCLEFPEGKEKTISL